MCALATEKSIIAFLEGTAGEGRRWCRSARQAPKDGDSGERIVFSGDSDGMENLNEQKLAEMADDAPVVTLVNGLIFGAIERKASDIHIETYEDHMRIRYRVDGVHYELPNPRPERCSPRCSRYQDHRQAGHLRAAAPPRTPDRAGVDERKIDSARLYYPRRLRRERGAAHPGQERRAARPRPARVHEKRGGDHPPHGRPVRTDVSRGRTTGSGKTTTLYGILQYNQAVREEDPDRRGSGRVTSWTASARFRPTRDRLVFAGGSGPSSAMIGRDHGGRDP